MTTFIHTCEGADGVDITTTNAPAGSNNFGLVGSSADTFEYDTSRSVRGTSSLYINAGTQTGYGRYADSADQSLVSSRFYIYFPSYSNNNTFWVVRSSGDTRVLALAILSSGKITANDTSANLWTSTGTIPLNRWHRIEVQIDASAAAGSQKYWVNTYELHSQTAIAGLSTAVSTANFTTIKPRYHIYGKYLSTVAGSWWMDCLQTNTATLTPIGPIAPMLSIWNGTSESQVTLESWDGASLTRCDSDIS